MNLYVYASHQTFLEKLYKQLESIKQDWKIKYSIWECRMLTRYIDELKQTILYVDPLSDFWFDRCLQQLWILSLQTLDLPHHSFSISESSFHRAVETQYDHLLHTHLLSLYSQRQGCRFHTLWMPYHAQWILEWKQTIPKKESYASFISQKLPSSTPPDYVPFLETVLTPLPLPSLSFVSFLFMLIVFILLSSLLVFASYFYFKINQKS